MCKVELEKKLRKNTGQKNQYYGGQLWLEGKPKKTVDGWHQAVDVEGVQTTEEDNTATH